VPREDREAIRKLRRALGRSKTISVIPLDCKYPMGSEFQLIEALTGTRRGENCGVFTDTVATAFATAEAVLAGKPAIERVVTVAGDGVRETRNLKVRIGTSIGNLIAWCGGFTAGRIRLIHGGPMTGQAIHSDRIPVTKKTTGILAFAVTDLSAVSEGSCISCGRCLDCCPMRLYPRQIELWILRGDHQRAAAAGLDACILCGSCGYVCPSKRKLTSRIAEEKATRSGEKARRSLRDET
jgi:Na+-translocating ferredoxin:NAD+ oxidoreductase subunit C